MIDFFEGSLMRSLMSSIEKRVTKKTSGMTLATTVSMSSVMCSFSRSTPILLVAYSSSDTVSFSASSIVC